MGKQEAQTTHHKHSLRRQLENEGGDDGENMKIDIKEFGETDTNKHELCPVQWPTMKSVSPVMYFSPLTDYCV